MANNVVELHDKSVGPMELSSKPAKTAAQVLNACARRFHKGVGTLSPEDKPNFALEAEDTVAGGVTYIFIPSAGIQGPSDALTAGALFVHNLHNSLPSLVQTLKAAHCKPIVNRDIRPSNLMHSQSTIFLVDWGSATLLQRSLLYEGTIHYASVGVLQQLTQDFTIVETGPADDLESLVASMFCVSHPDAHQELQRGAKLPALVMQWWIQTWNSRPQWQLALTAAGAANHDAVADCLQALLE